MDVLPTVRVDNPADPGGYMTINESDFDAKVHTLWQERKPEPRRDAAKKAPAAKAE